MSADNAKLGLIGLGLMGSALAERARSAGFDVIGFDLDGARCAALEQSGVAVVDSAAAVADQAATIVFAVLTTDQVAASIESMGDHLRAGAIVVDTTTGLPDAMTALATRLSARAIEYVDACVAGNSEQVRQRDVVVLAGGTTKSLERIRPLLSAFARQIIHVGPVGRGAQMKLVVNLALGLHRAVLAEALEFAHALGLERAKALEALQAGPAQSRVMDIKGAKMIARDYRPQAKLVQHLKDVVQIKAAARAADAVVPLTTLHMELLERLVEGGWGAADNCAIIEAFRSHHGSVALPSIEGSTHTR